MQKDTKVEDLKDYIEDESLSSRAITIDAIADDEIESDFLIDEVTELFTTENKEEDLSKYGEYAAYLKEDNEDYIDAFDKIEYIADLENVDEFDLDDATEEIFPGVRVMKKKLTEDDADAILESVILNKK